MIAILISGGIALLTAGFGTPILMRWLTTRRIGQQVRHDGPALHFAKAGTPTMGGIAMVIATVLGYVLGHVGTKEPYTSGGILVVAAVVASAVIGLFDDWIKVHHSRSLGLKKRGKFSLQIVVAAVFAYLAIHLSHLVTTLTFTRYDRPGLELGVAGWIILAVLSIVSSSNAVNLTDGLDGLAAGATAFAASCFGLIGYWEYRHPLYHVVDSLDLAMAAIAIAGACVGFLWWNAAPARIFMGDTGSLALGTGLACLALELNVLLLLPIIGGLFVLETLSVILQIFMFRGFHRRIFRMAPLHHHFELLGWPETTVIIRFWILGALFSALALGVFYADFLSLPAH
ncbi:MAG TPA: phospho-N-acetylmuramoyl-pentapeptide-transferase [Acidimicrobiales bacterium]|nr:phospho-N-acetylmuramoyl-pentapeptide-transferase [Acidimicrobiales bacterium]